VILKFSGRVKRVRTSNNGGFLVLRRCCCTKCSSTEALRAFSLEDEVVSVIQAKIFIDGVHQDSLLIQGKLSSDYFPEHELIIYDHNEIAL